MLRLLIDQDLDHVILRGLLLRVPNLDVITAHQAGLSNASDSEVLAWAAEQERIVITHDRRTMPYHATSRNSQSGEGCRCHRRFEAIAHQPSDQ
jgi:predicted nuclease of predicted toxin-antitoxin system